MSRIPYLALPAVLILMVLVFFALTVDKKDGSVEGTPTAVVLICEGEEELNVYRLECREL